MLRNGFQRRCLDVQDMGGVLVSRVSVTSVGRGPKPLEKPEDGFDPRCPMIGYSALG